MSDFEQIESLWKDWVRTTTSELLPTHSPRVGEAPFDTWVGWYRPKELPAEGWKLHLSPQPEIIGAVLGLLVELSKKLPFDFKVIGHFKNFIRLNAGHLGESQVGKTITIYPDDPETALCLYEELQPLAQMFMGPQCPSDFYFNEDERISFRWGLIGNPKTTYDALGKPQHKLQTPTGQWIEDQRKIPALIPPDVPLLQWRSKQLKPLSFELPTQFEWDGLIFKVKHNYGRTLKQVLLVEELNTQKLFIIKRLWNGLGLTARGRTYKEEAINEAEINKYLTAQGAFNSLVIRAQRQSRYFFETLMDDAGGDSLEKLPLEMTQQNWENLLELVKELHQNGVIHRDLKRGNIVLAPTAPNNLKLIDFELAGIQGKPLPCSSGTSSYKAPESEVGAIFSPSIDTYALGSILFEISLGRDPSLYLIPEAERVQLLELNGMTRAARLVEKCYRPADQRCSLTELQCLSQQQNLFEKTSPSYEAASFEEISAAIENAIQGLESFEAWQKNGTLQWRNNHLLSTVNHHGINIGGSGILLGLLELAKSGITTEAHLARSIEATAQGLAEIEPYELAHGFMTGNAGIAFALSKASLQMNQPQWLERALAIWKNSATQLHESDFFSGAAGILYVGSHIKQHHGVQELDPLCEQVVQHLLSEVTDYEGLWAWPASSQFGGHATLGASHGAAGIAMVLSHWAYLQADQGLMEFAVEVFQRIFKYGRTTNGHYLRYDIHPQSQPRAHTDWCHGAGSFLWAMLNSQCPREELREALNWGEQAFLQSPIASNPTFCHGLAGQLELSQMLGNEDRTHRLERGLLLQRRPFRTGKTWASENPEQFTPDLWVGFLGPAVALARAQRAETKALFHP